MKPIVYILMLLLAVQVMAGQLDIRKFQYPVEDAKKSAKQAVPRFCTFILSDTSKPRLPGISRDQASIIASQYRTKLMNEYRLYTKGKIDQQEKVLLERYCSRYNRMLASELGI